MESIVLALPTLFVVSDDLSDVSSEYQFFSPSTAMDPNPFAATTTTKPREAMIEAIKQYYLHSKW